jgi:proteasome accessory factor A
VVPQDMTLENPVRAIREVSHDMTGRCRVRLASGRELSALQIQHEYLNRVRDFTSSSGLDAAGERVLELWERALAAIEAGNLDKIAREIDWVTKYQLIERYRAAHDLPLSAARVAQLDLAYHDIRRGRGLYYLLQRDGAVERVTRDLDVFAAKSVPPQTTRAKLRGDFIRQAQEKGRDFSADWVHLKLNDQAQRTVLCKDPFRSVDERVDRLIASM